MEGGIIFRNYSVRFFSKTTRRICAKILFITTCTEKQCTWPWNL